MIRALRVTLFVALLLTSRAHAQGSMDSIAAAAEVERLERQWATALVQQDTALLQRLLAPEFALVVSALPQRPMARAAWFATLPDYQTRALHVSGLTVRVLGDLAIASFIGDLAARVKGAERRGKYFLTDVWRQRHGTWQVIARYSSRPEEASTSTRALEKMTQDSARRR